MAPFRESDAINFDVITCAAVIGLFSTILATVLGCLCCRPSKKDNKGTKEQEKLADVPLPPDIQPLTTEPEVAKGNSGILTISARGPMGDGSGESSLRSGDSGKSAQGKPIGEPATTPLAKSSAKSSAKIRTPVSPKPETGSTKSAPAPAAKSIPAPPSVPKVPAPPAKTAPQLTPPPSDDDFVKMPKKTEVKSLMPAASVVAAPRGAVRPGPAVWQRPKPEMEFVPADSPAYRSLVGLDDAFTGTAVATGGSVYGTKKRPESLMPSAQSVTHQISAESASSVDISIPGQRSKPKAKGKKKAKKR